MGLGYSRARGGKGCDAKNSGKWREKLIFDAKVKVKQFHYRPRGFQEVKVPRFS